MNCMRIFDRFLRKKDAQTSRNGKITVKEILDFAKTYEELRPFFAFFVYCFRNIVDSEKKIEQKVKEIQTKTQQNLKEDQLFKELWILRYVCLYIWFIDLRPPKDQAELSDELLVINSALKNVLEEKNKLDYLPWLNDGLSDFNISELNFNNLKQLKKDFSEKLAERVPHIAFECTEGRLGGELHDLVTELIMATIQRDKKVFSMDDESALTEEGVKDIKNTIVEMSEVRREIAENFMNSVH